MSEDENGEGRWKCLLSRLFQRAIIMTRLCLQGGSMVNLSNI